MFIFFLSVRFATVILYAITVRAIISEVINTIFVKVINTFWRAFFFLSPFRFETWLLSVPLCLFKFHFDSHTQKKMPSLFNNIIQTWLSTQPFNLVLGNDNKKCESADKKKKFKIKAKLNSMIFFVQHENDILLSHFSNVIGFSSHFRMKNWIIQRIGLALWMN